MAVFRGSRQVQPDFGEFWYVEREFTRFRNKNIRPSRFSGHPLIDHSRIALPQGNTADKSCDNALCMIRPDSSVPSHRNGARPQQAPASQGKDEARKHITNDVPELPGLGVVAPDILRLGNVEWRFDGGQRLVQWYIDRHCRNHRTQHINEAGRGEAGCGSPLPDPSRRPAPRISAVLACRRRPARKPSYVRSHSWPAWRRWRHWGPLHPVPTWWSKPKRRRTRTSPPRR